MAFVLFYVLCLDSTVIASTVEECTCLEFEGYPGRLFVLLWFSSCFCYESVATVPLVSLV